MKEWISSVNKSKIRRKFFYKLRKISFGKLTQIKNHFMYRLKKISNDKKKKLKFKKWYLLIMYEKDLFQIFSRFKNSQDTCSR